MCSKDKTHDYISNLQPFSSSLDKKDCETSMTALSREGLYEFFSELTDTQTLLASVVRNDLEEVMEEALSWRCQKMPLFESKKKTIF